MPLLIPRAGHAAALPASKSSRRPAFRSRRGARRSPASNPFPQLPNYQVTPGISALEVAAREPREVAVPRAAGVQRHCPPVAVVVDLRSALAVQRIEATRRCRVAVEFPNSGIRRPATVALHEPGCRVRAGGALSDSASRISARRWRPGSSKKKCSVGISQCRGC